MSFVLLTVGVALGIELLWWWQADRLLRSLKLPRRARLAWSLFMAAQVGCLLWFILGRRLLAHPEDFVPRWVLIATFVWHLLVLPATFVLWMVVSTGRGVVSLCRTIWPKQGDQEPEASAETSPPTTPRGFSRRQFIGATMAAAPPLATVIATGYSSYQLQQFRLRPMTVALPQLPPELDGMTIAHVSDIHVGRFTNGRILPKIVDVTNNLRADLVLLTGDLINMELADLPAALDVVKKLDAKSGVFMCEGNHDLIEDRGEFERRTRASGVPLMVNESTTVSVRGRQVQLLGLRWGTGAPRGVRAVERGDQAIQSSLRLLLPHLRRDPDAFPILLAHHPHAFDPASAAGIPLTLAGHTHGGQLMLGPRTGFGPWMYRYWSGAYRKDGCSLVVSNGVGNWFPLRVGAPAEIIHLTLRRT